MGIFRLKLWSKGNIDQILRECRTLQEKLTTGKQRPREDILRTYSNLIFDGKISPALKFHDDNTEYLLLIPTKKVIAKLRIILPPSAFNSITEDEILRAVKQVNGSGGPSQMDAKQWRRVLVSKHFKKEGKDLCEELATFARKIATEIVDPKTLESYTASRLLSLNKSPGQEEIQIRPIGVGEVLRRIVGKTISWALNEEIQEAGGALQVSTGLKGGAEAAIHGMKNIFELECTEAVILVDAENAFNKLNRQVALHNVQYLSRSAPSR